MLLLQGSTAGEEEQNIVCIYVNDACFDTLVNDMH